MKNLCFLITVIAGFTSCEWGVPKKTADNLLKDTLKYTYKTIKERAADCGNKPDSTCTVVKIQYPLFDSAATLNDTITRKLTALFATDNKPDSSLQLLGKNFLRAYDDFRKKNQSSAMYYTLNSYAKVVHQDSSLTTLEVGGYTFQGGAHGASFIFFINWDVKAGKNLRLDDIFTPGYQDKLTSVAEKIFRHDEKLGDTTSLARDYFFKDNKFALNDNFSVTPIGLRFLYNQYEIKPYAAGKTDLFIPYSQIKSLLQPNTVVSQFIK